MIYLDYNATTPVDETVLQYMLPFFNQHFGNAASSTHLPGAQAKEAITIARKSIATLLNCEENEITFNSGSTEGCNTVLKGIYNLYQTKGNHIVTVSTEHKAVLDTCAFLEKKGAEITYLNVHSNGLIDLSELENAVTSKTVLVAIMLANNETGVIQPIRAAADIIHAKDSILFSDATQAIGKIPVDVAEMKIDAMCISAHKFYGPKGTGALYLKRKEPRVTVEPLIHGGGHERGIRSGTLNVPGIAGMGKAAELFSFANMSALRDLFEERLLSLNKNIRINGSTAPRLPNTSSLTLPVKAVDLIRHTKLELAFAAGSACTSAENKPSHVLTAMGLTKEEAERTVRFSFGKYTTAEEIETAVRLISSYL